MNIAELDIALLEYFNCTKSGVSIVMDSSTVNMEKMIMISAFQLILSINSWENMEQRNVYIECIVTVAVVCDGVLECADDSDELKLNLTFKKKVQRLIGQQISRIERH